MDSRVYSTRMLTFWNRGVDFDDEELEYHEENKPAIKV